MTSFQRLTQNGPVEELGNPSTPCACGALNGPPISDTAPTKQSAVLALQAKHRDNCNCPTCQAVEIFKLQTKIDRAREELKTAKKGMGGLARISFQKYIDAALKALE